MEKLERLQKFFELDGEVIFMQDGMTYYFYEPSAEEGIMYDIYDGRVLLEDIENGKSSIDGGLCTGGDFMEALRMAGVIN